jgi:hypothetical protein
MSYRSHLLRQREGIKRKGEGDAETGRRGKVRSAETVRPATNAPNLGKASPLLAAASAKLVDLIR